MPKAKRLMSDICNNTDRKIRVLDLINTHQCARELLDNRVAQVNATGRYDNAIYCSSGEFVELLRKKGHTVYVVENPRNLSPIKMAVCIWKTTRLLRKHRFHIIHTHTSVPSLVGRLAGFLTRTPIVIHQVHGYHYHDNMNLILKWSIIIVEKFFALLTDKILFQNQADVEECLRRKIAPRRKLVLIGNGTQIDDFKTEKEVNNNPPIILYVARMEPVKNHTMLLEAACILKERNVAFKIQLAGDGELMPKYEAWVHEHGLDEHIAFLGYREDVPALIVNADVCVLVSLNEGLPRGIIEAAAGGRPMVATDVDGSRDVLVNGTTGFLVPLNDVTSLADRLEQLLSNAALRAHIGQEARKYALKHFDERVVTDRIIDVYDDMIVNEKSKADYLGPNG